MVYPSSLLGTSSPKNPKKRSKRGMKIKNKGKVHPSPTTTTTDPVLHLLPPAIISLASVLPPHDLQVLSYLLARSLRLSTPNYSSSPSSSHASSSPSSDCDCFYCYTFYWLRWDSSPNRDLIHRVIDAFEEHLSPSSSTSSSPAAGKSKVVRRRGKDRHGGRNNRELPDIGFHRDVSCTGGAPGTGDVVVVEESERNNDDDEAAAAVTAAEVTSPRGAVPSCPARTVGGEHKGLARKVLPDVLGILNSRLWNLWSPDV